METILVYLLAGCVSGLISGLFGLGGGVVIVPVLLFVFTAQGVPAEVMVHMAVASSLAVIIITSLSSIRAHWKLGGVLWPVALRLAPGIVVGALLGALIAHWMSGALLQAVFALFLVVVAVRMGLNLQPPATGGVPGAIGLSAVGTGIGCLSAIVGIGGGTMTVPFLSRCRIAMREAVGTSAVCGLPIAVAGTLGFIITGWGHPQVPAYTSGYVYWPAVAGITAASIVLAPVGARLAHRLPQVLLRRLFAVLLAVVAARLLFGVFG